MSFNNIAFLFAFLPIVLILYYVVPGKIKDLVLVLGSLIFYAWGAPIYVLLLAFSVVFNYVFALQIEADPKRSEGVYKAAILANVAVYIFFGFIATRAGLSETVPLGLGIFTLQVISYLVDVSHGTVRTQKKILDFALYLALFPVFIAGPAVKYRDVKKSLEHRKISIGRLGEGMALFTCGLLKKILLADRMLFAVSQVEALEIGEISALTAWIGVVAFALRLYFAFSGYCDMAAGLCKMFGIDLGRNFRYPYMAKNITDFAGKWNTSVSLWFREYVRDPLFGGWLGTLTAWILMGLWYSATWKNAPWETTVLGGLLWGLYMAILLIIERYFLTFLKRLPIILRNIYTMFFVLIGWVFFWSATPARAFAYLGTMFGIGGHGLTDTKSTYLLNGNTVLLVIMIIGSTPLVHKLAEILFYHGKNKEKRHQIRAAFHKNTALVLSCALLIVSVLNLVVRDKNAPEGTEPFVFRKLVSSLDTNINLLVGRREANGVFKGSDHQLFADINKMDEEEVSKTVAAINQLAEDYSDVPVYMALIPDAANVWKNKLPNGAVAINQSEQLTTIKDALDSRVTWVDAENILNNNANVQIYYHTDSKWTTLGAKYVWEEFASQSGIDLQTEPATEAYAVTGNFSGDLSAKSGYETSYREPIYAFLPEDESQMTGTVVNYESEGIRTAAIYEKTALDSENPYDVFLNGDYDKITIRTTAESTERLLVVKDSWANCMIPFMISHYREIIIVDPDYYVGNVQKLLDENKITSVLFLFNCNNFVQNDMIRGVLANDKTE